DLESLRGLAEAHRPEIAAVEADLAAADARHALALRGSRPDLTVGLSYTAVEKRADLAGRLTPPEDDGDNLFALTASLNLPVRRRKLDAAVREAEELKWAAEEERRGLDAAIESTLGDLAARLPMLDEHLTLLEKVLITQAREALRSAEIAYSTGRLSAVDLLDAEVILLQVEIAAARTRADLEIALASLERAVARPLAGAEETADE
ncbi:MAG: TolC family protein, partial [Acidobacteriota bacterium]